MTVTFSKSEMFEGKFFIVILKEDCAERLNITAYLSREEVTQLSEQMKELGV